MTRFQILRQIWAPFSDSPSSTYAASACFYMLISLLPALLLSLSVLPYLPLEPLWNLLPQAFRPIADYVLELVQEADPVAAISLSAVITLWSASKGVMAISTGLNAVMGFSGEASFFKRRLHAMISFLLLLTCLFALPFVSGILVVPALWLFFSLLYWLLPKRRITFRCCCLGSILPTVGWLVLIWLFSIYVNYFSSYQRLYGSLGLLLMACIWLQWCILLLLYGGLLSKLVFEKKYRPFSLLRQFFS